MGNRNSGRRKDGGVLCRNCGVGEKLRGSWCRECRKRYSADYKRLKGQAEGLVDYGSNLSWRLLDDLEDKEGIILEMAVRGEYVVLEVGEMMRMTDYYLDSIRK